MRDLVTIGIVGCGYRGSEVAAQVGKRLHERAQIVGVYDTDFERAGSLASYLGPHVRMFTSIEDLIDRARFVVEVASNDALVPLVPLALKAGRAVLVTSVGGLVEHPRLLEEAEASNGRLLIPSGMIAGVDALKACMAEAVSSVALTCRFPRGMLGDAPYVQEHDVEHVGVQLSQKALDVPRHLLGSPRRGLGGDDYGVTRYPLQRPRDVGM